jgi:hypothetical protein
MVNVAEPNPSLLQRAAATLVLESALALSAAAAAELVVRPPVAQGGHDLRGRP